MASPRSAEFVDIRQLPPMEVVFGLSSAMALPGTNWSGIADTNVPVLLQGENGTGKDILAKLLHARSNRAKSAWVKVTCPAIPHSLIESELFGYEKGAFTGAYVTKRGRLEVAHMGTLFLDEVGSLDIPVRPSCCKCSRMVALCALVRKSRGESDTRLICAANGNLRRKTEDGSFRLDFFYRINAVTIDLPPLRQRRRIFPSDHHFMELYS